MTIINLTPEQNGAHANQSKSGVFKNIPNGWVAIPTELEDAAKTYMPWLSITAENGIITAICENTTAKEAWEAAEAARIAAFEAADNGSTQGGIE